MTFFTFNQNNSGGGFDFDERAGIAHYVIVEADSAAAANARAEAIGIYFDHEYEIDCECCGTRWYEAWEDDGDAVPSIYGTPVQDYFEFKFMGNDPEVFVHFADGHFQGYGFETKVLEG